MDHLVYVDAKAGDLEKILSGVKTMIACEAFHSQSIQSQLQPGDSLYFLRNNGECVLRMKATVARVLLFVDDQIEEYLKEMQSRLQLTEDQYNYWEAKNEVLLIEFEDARKIAPLHIEPGKIMPESGWIAVEDIHQLTD